MKKSYLLFFVVVFLAVLFAAAFLSADSRDDLQVIKKAVKEAPAPQVGKEVKWFKILVTDNKTGKERVKVTLPIAVVELFLGCAQDRCVRIQEKGCDIDLAVVFRELKAMGPMALIEIYEEDETVKIWLE